MTVFISYGGRSSSACVRAVVPKWEEIQPMIRCSPCLVCSLSLSPSLCILLACILGSRSQSRSCLISLSNEAGTGYCSTEQRNRADSQWDAMSPWIPPAARVIFSCSRYASWRSVGEKETRQNKLI